MPGCCDVVSDGWNGFLVPPRAPRILAERILDHLRDRGTASVMGARASELVKREFNLGITVARYAAAYKDLLYRVGQDRRYASKDGALHEPCHQNADHLDG
jgi:glycosyltransferase involved in cell wall biosynthesis